MQSVAEPVKSAFAQLSKVVSDLEDEHAEFQMRFQEILNDFEKEAGHIWTETFRTKVADTFHSLAERAVEPQFPKELIERLAHARQSTKTPPGFKDAGDGDLYVWAEFLLGLVEARDSGDKFELAVLITEDKKSDWGKGGEAHPILAAELFELVGVPFETWDFRKMKEYANGATAN
ncbi:hypothetical protein A5784_14770 [Mycobacterium sp. 852013-50091_SCH5140682]|nr:hypothetical protein A5784_14770 [Mycobacterium sp. 852013-50091_SCH5140682]